MPSTYVRKMKDLPRGEHWAIITDESVFVPGDERSKMSPGHGYPERTEHYLNYQAFTNEHDFKEELKKLLTRQQECRGVHVVETFGKRVIYEVEVETETR